MTRQPARVLEPADLRRLYADLPDARAFGVVQNLRLANLYEGALSRSWSPQLANAINEAHFDLDFVDERYDLTTDGGAESFLQDLSYPEVRPRLIAEVEEGPAEFVQIAKPGIVASSAGRKCVVSGGTYSRNGELLSVRFYEVSGQAGVDIEWDGWPGSVFPGHLPVRFGDQTLPMMTGYEVTGSIIEARIFNENGGWVIDGLKRAVEIEIGPGSEINPLVLPTGDLYATAKALEDCAAN